MQLTISVNSFRLIRKRNKVIICFFIIDPHACWYMRLAPSPKYKSKSSTKTSLFFGSHALDFRLASTFESAHANASPNCVPFDVINEVTFPWAFFPFYLPLFLSRSPDREFNTYHSSRYHMTGICAAAHSCSVQMSVFLNQVSSYLYQTQNNVYVHSSQAAI